MKNFKKYTLLAVVALMVVVTMGACKNVAKVEMVDTWGRAAKVIGEDKSALYMFAHLVNKTPGIEITIKKWSFKLYEGSTLVLEINQDNYDELGAEYGFDQALVRLSKPVSYYGDMVIKVGIPDFEAYNHFVDADLFKGAKPNRLVFECSTEDVDGGWLDLTQSFDLIFVDRDISED